MKREFNYTVTSQDEQEQRSIRELMRREFSFSSRLWSKIKKQRAVFLNGEEIQVWKVPAAGDLLTIRLPEEQSHFPPQDIPIAVLYEDDDLLLINKQPHITVHPTGGCPDHTIANGLMQYMLDTHQQFKIRFINRLDMDTSGVLAIGKNAYAQDDFVKQQKRGHVIKEYLALVNGIMTSEEGTIDAPIGRPANEPLRRGIVPVEKGGKASVTHFHVLKRYPPVLPSQKKGYTLLALRLETGRTHQIRVHLSSLGHPVTGDWLYGASSPLIDRQVLHAASLTFPHPLTGQTFTVSAPLPEDIQRLLLAIQ